MKKSTRALMLVLALILFTGMAIGSGSSDTDEKSEKDILVDKASEEEADNTQEKADEEKDKPAQIGTRENPIPIGQAAKIGDNWEVAVLEIDEDAWETIKAENQFNDPPKEGHQFVLAKIEAKYVGDDSGTPWLDLSIKYLGSGGNSFDDSVGVKPDALDDKGEMFAGATVTGYDGWEVASDEVKGGLLIIEESLSFSDTRLFFEAVK